MQAYRVKFHTPVMEFLTKGLVMPHLVENAKHCHEAANYYGSIGLGYTLKTAFARQSKKG